MSFSLAPLRWHVIRTWAKAEWAVTLRLLGDGHDVIFPYTLKSDRWHRHPQGVATALFPGYIFAGFDQSQSVHDLSSISRCTGALRVGGDLVRLSENQVQAIRKQALEEMLRVFTPRKREASRWIIGSFQAIPIGVTAGVPAYIESIDKNGTVRAYCGQVQFSWPASTALYESV